MSDERTDPSLLVTSSGVVHKPGCPRLRSNNAYPLRWDSRFEHDRPCKQCRPTFPEEPA